MRLQGQLGLGGVFGAEDGAGGGKGPDAVAGGILDGAVLQPDCPVYQPVLTSRFFFSVSTATPWVLRVVFTASWAVENTSARPSVL